MATQNSLPTVTLEHRTGREQPFEDVHEATVNDDGTITVEYDPDWLEESDEHAIEEYGMDWTIADVSVGGGE